MYPHPTILETLAILGPLAVTSAALAHVTLETAEAPSDSSHKAVLRVPHGCDGQWTHALRIRMPGDRIALKPISEPGRKLATVEGPCTETYDDFASKPSERSEEVIWSGAELLDVRYDEFVLRGRPADLPPGTSLCFETVQECANAAERSIEIPAKGQKASDLERAALARATIEKISSGR